MAIKRTRIVPHALMICLSAPLGGCLSLTSLVSNAPPLTVDSVAIAEHDDIRLIEVPAQRRSDDGVDPVVVLTKRTYDQEEAAAAEVPKHLPTFAVAPSEGTPGTAVTRRRVQPVRSQVSNADIARRDRQAEVLIRKAVHSICEGCDSLMSDTASRNRSETLR